MADITHLHAYHMRDQDGEEELIETPTGPVPKPYGKPIFLTEKEIDVIENAGLALIRLGAPDTGMVLTSIATAWRLT